MIVPGLCRKTVCTRRTNGVAEIIFDTGPTMFRFLAAIGSSSLFFALLITGSSLQAQKPTYIHSSEPLILDQKTVVPTRTLDPGTYSIRIVDQFTDRFILQVEDAKETPLATFIGLYSPDFDASQGSNQHGPLFWSNAPKGSKAMRAYGFHNGNTLEFVYPKEQAVALAQLNINSVPAIDPASENRKPDPKLSPEDRQVVTLWLLKATRVGPKNDTPAIEAKRYLAPSVKPNPAPVQMAAATPPPPLRPQQSRPAPVQVAKADAQEAPHIHAKVKNLPQTASNLPLLFVLSLVFLIPAVVLRALRSHVRV